ncbi:MAG: sel1 repeat family protein [Lachnospiraceae bacterium]|nr:sel1 repeat family protein [Lachnospiraceae bacterium]
MQEAESISKLDVYAPNTKEELCKILGVELEVGAESIDVQDIEKQKARLNTLKQYTDDENLWDKVDQVAFDQEDLADLLDQGCREIYLCGENIHIPMSVHDVKYIGVKKFFVVLDGESGSQYRREHKISINNLKYDSGGLDEGENRYLEYDLPEALELLTREAENGEGRAMWMLYMIYTHGGCCIDPDAAKAKEWCLKGKDVGDPLATLYCALFFSDNDDAKKQLCQSIKPKVKEMADNGDVLAQFVYGVSYINETDEAINHERALEYLRKSANAGYWRAYKIIGDIYMEEFENKVDEDDNDELDDAQIEKMWKSIIDEWYTKGADAGDVDAQLILGEFYDNSGRGYDKGTNEQMQNFQKASEYYKKASEQYSIHLKQQWKDEALRMLNNVQKVECHSMLYEAEKATGCDDLFLGLHGKTFSTEDQCISAAMNRINNLIDWLEKSWERDHQRIWDVVMGYDAGFSSDFNRWIIDYAGKIIGKSPYEMSKPDVCIGAYEIRDDIAKNKNYGNYSSYEAENSIQCLDVGGNDTNIFRQAKWKFQGWNDACINKQEKEKCEDFAEAMYQGYKKRFIEPWIDWVNENFKV